MRMYVKYGLKNGFWDFFQKRDYFLLIANGTVSAIFVHGKQFSVFLRWKHFLFIHGFILWVVLDFFDLCYLKIYRNQFYVVTLHNNLLWGGYSMWACNRISWKYSLRRVTSEHFLGYFQRLGNGSSSFHMVYLIRVNWPSHPICTLFHHNSLLYEALSIHIGKISYMQN